MTGVAEMAAEMNQMKMHRFVGDIISWVVILEGLNAQWRICVSATNLSVMENFIADKV